jgi:hypothetical protein
MKGTIYLMGKPTLSSLESGIRIPCSTDFEKNSQTSRFFFEGGHHVNGFTCDRRFWFVSEQKDVIFECLVDTVDDGHNALFAKIVEEQSTLSRE